MTSVDLSEQFEAISDRARAAADNLKDAEHRTRERLEFDADFARDRATSAADRLRDRAALAEDHALDTIDFATAVIGEAESAVLSAMYARANADAFRSVSGE